MNKCTDAFTIDVPVDMLGMLAAFGGMAISNRFAPVSTESVSYEIDAPVTCLFPATEKEKVLINLQGREPTIYVFGSCYAGNMHVHAEVDVAKVDAHARAYEVELADGQTNVWMVLNDDNLEDESLESVVESVLMVTPFEDVARLFMGSYAAGPALTLFNVEIGGDGACVWVDHESDFSDDAVDVRGGEGDWDDESSDDDSSDDDSSDDDSSDDDSSDDDSSDDDTEAFEEVKEPKGLVDAMTMQMVKPDDGLCSCEEDNCQCSSSDESESEADDYADSLEHPQSKRVRRL
jgi:hypothetical protein